MKLTIALYTFVITFFLLLVFFRYSWSRQKIRERFTHLVDASIEGKQNRNQDKGLYSMVRKFSCYFESTSWARQKESLLMQAGIPFRGSEFIVVSLGLTGLSLIVFFVLTGGNLWVTISGGILAFFIPAVIISIKIKKRRALFNEQLPDALTLMANSMRSGYSYMRAIDLVSKEFAEPLGPEFKMVLEETNLGIKTEEAFNNLAKRVNTDDVDLTVTAFLIQRQVGGNLAELLDNISATIRARVVMKEKIKTLTTQGKVSAFVLCSLPFVVGIAMFLLNDQYMKTFLSQQLGLWMIGLGVLGQVVGILWMRKIVNIEV